MIKRRSSSRRLRTRLSIVGVRVVRLLDHLLRQPRLSIKLLYGLVDISGENPLGVCVAAVLGVGVLLLLL